MSWQNLGQVVVLAVLLGVTVPPLGRYIGAVYGSREDGSGESDRNARTVTDSLSRLSKVGG